MNIILGNSLNRFDSISFNGAKMHAKARNQPLPVNSDTVFFKDKKNADNVNIFGYDGTGNEGTYLRNLIREHLYENRGIVDDKFHNGRNLYEDADYAKICNGSSKKINNDIIKETKIPNLFETTYGGYRGKMLVGVKGDVFEKLKESGVNTIIDLRCEASSILGKACAARGFDYMNLPVVLADTQSDDVLIENLPKFIKAINDGDFFIGCATGCQRTDIALAIAYCFDPTSKNIPLMLGYRKNEAVNFSKINETLNRIFSKLSPEQKESIGGFELHKQKRKELVSFNNESALTTKVSLDNGPKSKKRENKLDKKALEALNVPNFAMVGENGVRGESLSAKRNRYLIKDVASCGVKNIIDLRTTDHTLLFEKLCENEGLKCLHIPIDFDSTPTKEIIKSLPRLFKTINEGNFYISCAQGLHRTDIALSINYLFNPKAGEIPPQLIGHIKNGQLRYNDIFTRANNIYRNLTSRDKALLGWNDEFDENYKNRKINLVNAQQINN